MCVFQHYNTDGIPIHSLSVTKTCFVSVSPIRSVHTIRSRNFNHEKAKRELGEKKKIITAHPPLSALSSHLHSPSNVGAQAPFSLGNRKLGIGGERGQPELLSFRSSSVSISFPPDDHLTDRLFLPRQVAFPVPCTLLNTKHSHLQPLLSHTPMMLLAPAPYVLHGILLLLPLTLPTSPGSRSIFLA